VVELAEGDNLVKTIGCTVGEIGNKKVRGDGLHSILFLMTPEATVNILEAPMRFTETTESGESSRLDPVSRFSGSRALSATFLRVPPFQRLQPPRAPFRPSRASWQSALQSP
jgi:hypothetical protein